MRCTGVERRGRRAADDDHVGVGLPIAWKRSSEPARSAAMGRGVRLRRDACPTRRRRSPNGSPSRSWWSVDGGRRRCRPRRRWSTTALVDGLGRGRHAAGERRRCSATLSDTGDVAGSLRAGAAGAGAAGVVLMGGSFRSTSSIGDAGKGDLGDLQEANKNWRRLLARFLRWSQLVDATPARRLRRTARADDRFDAREPLVERRLVGRGDRDVADLAARPRRFAVVVEVRARDREHGVAVGHRRRCS